MKLFFKYRHHALRYFSDHVEYNALVHVIGGIGFGILLYTPFASPHPVRWALVLLAISLGGHLYTLTVKNKNKK